jgi:hypothetical protein
MGGQKEARIEIQAVAKIQYPIKAMLGYAIIRPGSKGLLRVAKSRISTALWRVRGKFSLFYDYGKGQSAIGRRVSFHHLHAGDAQQ